MLTVIADDITGAAEMAGIGLRFGLRTALVFEVAGALPEVDLLVYATDTRSMNELKAIDKTAAAVRRLRAAGCMEIFKKTDSVLRGFIVPELQVLLKETGHERALLVPENPSKGRVIREGVYFIDNVPLDQTVFAQDPEFPAVTSDVKTRLPGIAGVVSPGEPLGERGIFVGNAASDADMDRYVEWADERTLLAGAADLFVARLRRSGWKERVQTSEFEGLGDRNAIIVCGSTVQHDLKSTPWFERKHVPMMNMPLPVFELSDTPKAWFSALGEVYEMQHSIALCVGHPVRSGGGRKALRLRNIMALAVSSLIDQKLPDELVIEGGATAFAVLKALGWSGFRVTDEITPGVVRMSLTTNLEELDIWHQNPVHITLKPGSYEWGERIFQ